VEQVERLLLRQAPGGRLQVAGGIIEQSADHLGARHSHSVGELVQFRHLLFRKTDPEVRFTHLNLASYTPYFAVFPAALKPLLRCATARYAVARLIALDPPPWEILRRRCRRREVKFVLWTRGLLLGAGQV
jgi:hypothetical protein